MTIDKYITEIIIFDKNPEWISCQTIHTNLLQAYLTILPSAHTTYIDNSSEISMYSGLSNILSNKPDRLILLDYRIPVRQILEFIHKMDDTYTPEIIIHIYGDFILNIASWNIDDHIYHKFKIKICVASNAQKKLVNQFIENSASISVIPFPINKETFFYNSHHNHADTTNLNFIYTGRLSYQKNIIELINVFQKLYHAGINHKLLLVGDFDDITMPYTKSYTLLNNYSRRVLNLINQTPNISYIPSVSQKELNAMYNDADIFISISTYNDEDYGMSVAEALCTGLPAILTKWGGFNDFLLQPNTIPISVHIDKYRPLPNQSTLFSALAFRAHKLFSNYDRTDFSSSMQNIFTIEAIAEQLLNMIQKNRYITKIFQSKIELINFKQYSFSTTKIEQIYNHKYYDLYKEYIDE